VAALTDLVPDDLNYREVLEALAPNAAPVTLVDGQTSKVPLRIGR
jgi:hypothetical protein